MKQDIIGIILLLKILNKISIIIITPPEKGKFSVPNNNFTKEDLSKKIHKKKNEKNINDEKNSKTKEKEENKKPISLKNEINKKPLFQFNIPKLSIPQEQPQETQKIIRENISLRVNKPKIKKISDYNKNIEGFYKHEAKSDRKITGNELLTNYFDMNDEIKIIINYMKNKSKKTFLYKTDKNLLFLDNVKEYLEENSKEEIQYELKKLIDLSIPITKKLIKEISIEIYNKGIKFNNLEINILFDCARIIDIYHKYIYFILIIGLTNALSSLEIDYRFAVVGDCQFKAIIKDFNEQHSEKVIKRIFECIKIQRYRTNIASCIKVALDYFPKLKEKNRRVFYIFTNGLDDEYYLYKEWNKEIFNKNNCYFSFLFYLPFLENKQEEEKNEIDFVDEELKEFSEKCNIYKNVSTFIIKNKENIFKGEMLTKEIMDSFKTPLIPKGEQEVSNNNSIYNVNNVKFELTKQINKNFKEQIQNFKDEIEKIEGGKKDEEKEEEEKEEIFEKEESNNFKDSLPPLQVDKNESQNIASNVGKIMTFSYKQNLSDFIQDKFKISKDKINFQLLEIIFEPNLPT